MNGSDLQTCDCSTVICLPIRVANLLMMGSEFGQHEEWKFNGSLDWHLTDHAPHQGIQNTLIALNKLYKKSKALHAQQFDAAGFEWISHDDAQNSVMAFIRKGGDENLVVICNMTPMPREDYQIGLPASGKYKLVFNSDDEKFGGSGYKVRKSFTGQKEESHNRDHSIKLSLPPLGVLVYD